MKKIWAIHGGGDWYDASADYLVLPEGMDLDAEKAKWRKWYNGTYVPGKGVKYISFVEWVKARGATEPSADQLEIWTEY